MELPQHDKAKVQFFLHTGGGASRTIEFGRAGPLPRAVFGTVEEAVATDDDFPHAIVGLNLDAEANAEAVDIAGGRLGHPPTSFIVEGDDLFKGTWEKLVERQDCWSRLIHFVLMFLCAAVSFMAVNISLVKSPWYLQLPLLLVPGEAVGVRMAGTMWQWQRKCVRGASRPLQNFWRFVFGALSIVYWTTCGALVCGFLIINLGTIFGSCLLTSLALASCGIRPAEAHLPFYRWLGLQGIGVPTLTLTVRQNGEAVGQP